MTLACECQSRHRTDKRYIELVGFKSVYELGGTGELCEHNVEPLLLEVTFLGSYEREQMRRRVEIADVDVSFFGLSENSLSAVSAAVGRL